MFSEGGPKPEEKQDSELEPKRTPREILGLSLDATKKDADEAIKRLGKMYKGGDNPDDKKYSEAVDAWLAVTEEMGEGNEFEETQNAVEGLNKNTKKSIADKIKNTDFNKIYKNKWLWSVVALAGMSALLTNKTEEPKKDIKPAIKPAVSSQMPESPIGMQHIPEFKQPESKLPEIYKAESKIIEKPEAEEKPDSSIDQKKEEFKKIKEELEEKAKAEETKKTPEKIETEKKSETRIIDKKLELQILNDFNHFIKGSKVQSEGNGSFIVDLGSKGCYRVLPETFVLLGPIALEYGAREKSASGFGAPVKREGWRKKAETEMIKIIKNNCEKVSKDKIEVTK